MLRQVLLGSVFAVGAASAVPAAATTAIIPPTNSQFAVYESVTGNNGQYTVFDNSSSFYVYEVEVSNPQAGFSATDATTRPNWTAVSCSSSSCGDYGMLGRYFDYFDNAHASTSGLLTDIAPGTSSVGQFTFRANLASTYILKVIDTNGNAFSVTGSTTAPPAVSGAPEPGAWALFMSGVAMLGGLLRRRRSLAGFA